MRSTDGKHPTFKFIIGIVLPPNDLNSLPRFTRIHLTFLSLMIPHSLHKRLRPIDLLNKNQTC